MTLGGKKLFERAAAVLSEICSNISLVGGLNTQLAAGAELNIRTLSDIHAAGTDIPRALIVGLYTALANADAPWIAVLACDLPFVTGDLMATLAAFCSDEFDAVVPVQQDTCSFEIWTTRS